MDHIQWQWMVHLVGGMERGVGILGGALSEDQGQDDALGGDGEEYGLVWMGEIKME